MGATTFTATAEGNTPNEAFRRAVKDAQYNYGHAGYTGTIAEKSSFVLVAPEQPDELAASTLADKLLSDCDPRIDDKWGPAGCIPIKGGSYLFVGWASE